MVRVDLEHTEVNSGCNRLLCVICGTVAGNAKGCAISLIPFRLSDWRIDIRSAARLHASNAYLSAVLVRSDQTALCLH